MTPAREAIEAAAQVADELRKESDGHIAIGYRLAHYEGARQAADRIAQQIRALSTPAEPEEPSEAMIEAGMDAANSAAFGDEASAIVAIYLAMRAARPAGGREGGA